MSEVCVCMCTCIHVHVHVYAVHICGYECAGKHMLTLRGGGGRPSTWIRGGRAEWGRGEGTHCACCYLVSLPYSDNMNETVTIQWTYTQEDAVPLTGFSLRGIKTLCFNHTHNRHSSWARSSSGYAEFE